MLENYRNKLDSLGDVPEAIQMSEAGQLFRFKKLIEIGDLRGKRVLDIGCGRADFYAFLRDQIGNVDYVGLDIVQELVDLARQKYPTARILCHDLLENPLEMEFDYVFVSMVLNNNVPNMPTFARELLRRAFDMTRVALGFNFVSSYVNFSNPTGINHDPAKMLEFCLEELSVRTELYHHYERCDVAVFVYR